LLTAHPEGLDFVFTVCDNAANQAASEVSQIWPGQSMSAPWDIPDPAALQGTGGTGSKGFPRGQL
jgi:hypothetical protein